MSETPHLQTGEPAGEDLLKLSTSHLRTRIAPGLEPEARYNVLLAARAAEMAWRDCSLAAAREEASRGIARAVNGQDPIAAIRSGQRDGDVVLHGALLAMTAIATYSTRPDILKDKERSSVEALCE